MNTLLVTFVNSEHYNLTGLSGWLQSPEYPRGYPSVWTLENPLGYPNDSMIVWNIEVPLGLRVALTFVDFDMESFYCSGESLTIYADDVEFGTFCGRHISREQPKRTIRSPNNHLTVTFDSMYGCRMKWDIGFKAYYHSEDIDECLDQNGGCNNTCHNVYGGFFCSCPPGYRLHSDGRTCTAEPRTTLLTEKSGEFDSNSLSKDTSYDHEWTIVAEVGYVIALSFSDFSTIAWFDCGVTFVKIYTGNEEFGPFCGDIHLTNLPAIIQSTSNVMIIRYAGHIYSKDGRVQAGYNITDPSSAPKCSSLLAPVNGRIIGRNSTYDQFVWFKCDDDHYMDGSMSRLCTKDGTWTGVQPHCYPRHRSMNENTGVINFLPYVNNFYMHFTWRSR
ncbi:mannan-binding lectin serine protease 1-like [Ptychodera flava]|uniref:mannan-binding lectin serine protease 1-like n=1 Tax=Ptychodera flava TaxID=63121 RepID=UPI003969EFB5